MMLDFSMLPAKLSDDPNDYVFRCNGVDVGRCYLRSLTVGDQWSWSIFVGVHVKRAVDGIPLAGYAASIDLAKQQFQEAFGRLLAAGFVVLPGV